ncbi:MAG TPA: flagellar motor switch protein FliN [Chloroflexota bacterium]|jgi:flagellar motor switch protein FliN/FliY
MAEELGLIGDEPGLIGDEPGLIGDEPGLIGDELIGDEPVGVATAVAPGPASALGAAGGSAPAFGASPGGAGFGAAPGGGAAWGAPEFRPLAGEGGAGEGAGIDLLLDVSLEVSVELGRTRMTIGELLSLRPGSVIELDKLAGEPADILVNGTRIARGEVVVVDEKFGVRVLEVVSPAKRLAMMG